MNTHSSSHEERLSAPFATESDSPNRDPDLSYLLSITHPDALYEPKFFEYNDQPMPSKAFQCRHKPRFFHPRDYLIHVDGTIEFI